MTALRCAVCSRLATRQCVNCAAAEYCSIVCQEKDSSLHNLLCARYASFEEDRPRPKDYAGTSIYKLGLIFPESRKEPKLSWIRIRRVYENESESSDRKRPARDENDGNVKGENVRNQQTHFECGVGHIIKGKYLTEQASWGRGNIEILFDGDVDDPKPEGQPRPFNACLSFLMRGHEDDLTEDEIREAASSWGGNIVVLNVLYPDSKIEKHKEIARDNLPEIYQDVTLNDLRAALNVFYLGAPFYSHPTLNPYLILDTRLWVKAIRIHCRDDEVLYWPMKYRAVWYQLAELEDCGTQELKKYRSDIARHLGMPLVISSSLSKSKWAKVIETEIPNGWSNKEALNLVRGASANPKHKLLWNNPRVTNSLTDRPLKCQCRLGTVTVYRKDHKDITAHEVEALASYCSSVLRGVMKGVSYDDDEARQKIVQEYMNPPKFAQYFKKLKADKIASGDMSWMDAAPYPLISTKSTTSSVENECTPSLGNQSG